MTRSVGRVTKQQQVKPLAVTMGDPAGIGLDILIDAWSKRSRSPLPPLVLFGDEAALRERAHRLGVPLDSELVADAAQVGAAPAERLPVVSVPLAVPARPGIADAANGGAVVASIERAVEAVTFRDCSAVVTNPISKETLYRAGFRHPGHTEFLAELAGRHRPGRSWVPVMMLAADVLRVVPLTIHIPLANVPAAVTARSIIDTVRIMVGDLERRFGLQKPRIAVAGLNPHAGEGGSIGREDVEVIAPAVAALKAEGLDVTGPLSADTMFHAGARETYDAALCMYHDQALIPIKTLAFDDGVNVTLGLPFVRTSPDHGTAFDIAGTGRARSTSLVAAIHMATRMVAAEAATGSS